MHTHTCTFLFYLNLGGWEKGNLGLELPCATPEKSKPQTVSPAQRGCKYRSFPHICSKQTTVITRKRRVPGLCHCPPGNGRNEGLSPPNLTSDSWLQ